MMSGTKKTVALRGLQPQPLAAYLGALGVLRICARQYDSTVTGAFDAEGFFLRGMDQCDVVELLLERWSPSPVLTPWNNASGFYDSSKGRLAGSAMTALLESGQPRFERLVAAIARVRELVTAAGYEDAPKEDEKAAFIAALRGTLSDDAVAWLDAVAVVGADDARMMPLLGSGGNEGVLDYSGLFLRSLVEILLGDHATSESLLRAALFGAPTSHLLERPGGQFDPGTAGGFNTGPGFESKGLPNNPWSFVLLVEGALVWASGLASRQQGFDSDYRFAVSPFTVRHRAAGYGSAGHNDDHPQRVRAETWVPVWRRPTTLSEIVRFIGEGRVEVSTRGRRLVRASDSLDFADAVSSLGVDRGVDSFVRYAFIKRRGESYIALPAGALDVRHRREVDLLRQLDPELEIVDRFFARFPSEQGPPAQLVSLRRAIDDARFEVAARGGADTMTRLVRALGALEMTLSRRDPGKDPRLPRPLGGLGLEWIDACGDAVEVRIAASLASIAATGGAGAIRTYLAPLDPANPGRYAPAPRSVGFSGVDFAERLANVLHRRVVDARARGGDGRGVERNPTWGSRAVSLEDVASFLEPELVDDDAIEDLLFGFTWVKPGWSALPRPLRDGPPLPRQYALLKLLLLPQAIRRGADQVNLTADVALLSLLRAGRVREAVERAGGQLRAKGLRPRRVIERETPVTAAHGRRLAAALLIPTREADELVRLALLPETGSEEREETIDVR